MKKNVDDSLSRAQQLIQAITGDQKLTPGLRKQLLMWLLDVPEGGVAEDALGRWAEDNITPVITAPDRAERRSFRSLAARLGLSLPTVYRSARLRRVALRVAAVLVPVAIALGASFFITDEAEYRVLAVEEGAQETFELPDGSTVMVEGPSRLTYPGDFADNRDVELDGRAFFKVTSDPRYPFTVRHDEMEVTVLGTEFGVSARSDAGAMQVVLDKGSVAVRHGEQRVVLDPGNKLTLDKTSFRMELTEVSAGEMLRLRGEKLSIDRMSVRDALRLTADYFGKELRVDPDVPTSETISLVLPEHASLETVLSTIDHISDSLECHIEGDLIHVTR